MLTIPMTFCHYATLPTFFGISVFHVRKVDSDHGIFSLRFLELNLFSESLFLPLIQIESSNAPSVDAQSHFSSWRLLRSLLNESLWLSLLYVFIGVWAVVVHFGNFCAHILM